MPLFADNRSYRRKTSKRFREELRGFGNAGIFFLISILVTGTIVIRNFAVPVGALLVLLWVRLSGTPWSSIGYSKPAGWAKTILAGVLFGCAFKLLTKAVLMPLLGAGPVNLQYGHLAGNTAMLPYAAWGMVVAGWAEETVYRGFLFERLRTALGTKKELLIVLITSVWFGLAHLPTQGYYGALHGLALGLVFGTVYSIKRNLFFVMTAHAAYDLLALALIFFEVERNVSEFFFQ